MSLISSIQQRDPANPTFFEVVLAYPGFHVIGFHKVSSVCWRYGLRALARFISHLGRWVTGIEIHPGAKIGRNLFIDHGMGVVIGETSVIGDNVLIYHGVTLGGKGGERAGDKRHPTVEDGAVIGACAQVLGNIRIGKGAKVGAGAVVTFDVADGVVVAGNPARIISCENNKNSAYGLPELLPDVLEQEIEELREEIAALGHKLKDGNDRAA
ncbi:MAG: serine acetyltransferase [Alphaproteobacteria bacterium]|jgi:serine O-acetyltransferase|nr:serine acetyltransferase [Alphaproteobacteria bacterium]